LVKIKDLDFDYKNVDVELGYDMRGSNVDNGDGVGGQVGANVGGFVIGVDIGANMGGFVDDDGVEKGVGLMWCGWCDTIKELMSYPKCKSVTVINNPARPGSNYREVNCINYN
jgi:hypothetical protein